MFQLVHHLAIDTDLARLRPQLPADQAQYRGLSGTGAAHHGNHFPAREVHAKARQNRTFPIGKLHITDFDEIRHDGTIIDMTMA